MPMFVGHGGSARDQVRYGSPVTVTRPGPIRLGVSDSECGGVVLRVSRTVTVASGRAAGTIKP